jgi:hypothetical protein
MGGAVVRERLKSERPALTCRLKRRAPRWARIDEPKLVLGLGSAFPIAEYKLRYKLNEPGQWATPADVPTASLS